MSQTQSDLPTPDLLGHGLFLEWPEGDAPENTEGNIGEMPFSTPGGVLRSRLNRLSLTAVQDWLQADLGVCAKPWPSDRALSSLWEWVNGTILKVNQQRWLLLPSLCIDQAELRVPQEWVDIPEWVADYYLAIQVNEPGDESGEDNDAAEGYLKIWGYATHAQLKQMGHYDPEDRTYSLGENQVLQSLDALSFAAEAETQVTRVAVDALAPLELPQAQNLIQRLASPEIFFPRQAIPFTLWGTLLQHEGWRQRLYEVRNGLPETRSVADWFRAGVSAIAEGWGWQLSELQVVPAIAMRSSEGAGVTEPEQVVSLPLVIQGRSLQLQISRLADPGDRPNSWRFSLVPVTPNELIPPGTCLRLLTEDLQPFDHNEHRAEQECDRLYVDVQLVPGEGLVWETDPLPEEYTREILRF